MVYGLLWDAAEEIRHRDTYSKLQRALLGMQDEYVGVFEVDLVRDWFAMLSYRGQEYLKLQPEGRYSEVIETVTERLVTEDCQEEFRRFTSLENLRSSLSRENRIELEYTIRSRENIWLRTIFQVTERLDGRPTKVTMNHADIDKQKVERLLQQQAFRDAYRYGLTKRWQLSCLLPENTAMFLNSMSRSSVTNVFSATASGCSRPL